MEIILTNNLFDFHDVLWRQEIGCAMGTRSAPNYANNFMARKLDKNIIKLATQNQKLFKRFLDDIFSIFKGTTKELHDLFNKMNELHESIKFTMNHTSVPNEEFRNKCDCEQQRAIPFLDVLCSVQDGRIDTDLYRNMYLLPSSCHTPASTKNIPFSLGLRIVRICSKQENREIQFSKLKELLQNRGYSERMIESATVRARGIPRNAALRRVLRKEENKRPVFALTYNPRLPSMPPILKSIGEPWLARTPTSLRYSNNHLLPHLRGRRISGTT